MNEIEATISTFERHHELDEQNRVIILSALREKAEREKGCPSCRDPKDTTRRWAYIANDGMTYSEQISFCPKCGRPLKEVQV